jgi:hypothetical protein
LTVPAGRTASNVSSPVAVASTGNRRTAIGVPPCIIMHMQLLRRSPVPSVANIFAAATDGCSVPRTVKRVISRGQRL